MTADTETLEAPAIEQAVPPKPVVGEAAVEAEKPALTEQQQKDRFRRQFTDAWTRQRMEQRQRRMSFGQHR